MSDYFSKTFYIQYSNGETAGCSFPINAFLHFPKERIWKASGRTLSSSACLVVWYISTNLSGKTAANGQQGNWKRSVLTHSHPSILAWICIHLVLVLNTFYFWICNKVCKKVERLFVMTQCLHYKPSPKLPLLPTIKLFTMEDVNFGLGKILHSNEIRKHNVSRLWHDCAGG